MTKDSEMVKRVARALAYSRLPGFKSPEHVWKVLGKRDRGVLCRDARAAIEAMCSPTTEMLDIGHAVNHGAACPDGTTATSGYEEVYIWKAMITAALGKEPAGG